MKKVSPKKRAQEERGRGGIVRMPYELITIIGTIGGLILTATVALAGLILTQSRAIRSELGELRGRISRLEDRLARLEGALDVLREFFVRPGRGTPF